jgi:tol-pal system protein YbgF
MRSDLRTPVFGLALMLAACATPTDHSQRMEERLDKVESDAAQSAKAREEQRAALRQQSAQLDAKLAELQKKIDEADAAAHRPGDRGPSEKANAKMADDLGRLRATIEEQSRRLDALEKGLGQLSRDTEKRFAALRVPAPQPKGPQPQPPPPSTSPTDEKASYLALARKHEANGEQPVAKEIYEEYLTKWPTDPGAAEAHFRLGELWFGEQRYRDAIVEYGKVAREFPRSDRVPDALLRTADAMLKIDLQDDATKLLQEIPKRYPGTQAAKQARARLAELSGSSNTASSTKKRK